MVAFIQIINTPLREELTNYDILYERWASGNGQIAPLEVYLDHIIILGPH
jgi:hypothetical protein